MPPSPAVITGGPLLGAAALERVAGLLDEALRELAVVRGRLGALLPATSWDSPAARAAHARVAAVDAELAALRAALESAEAAARERGARLHGGIP